MGVNYYMPGMEEFYGYPDYSIGNSKAVILAREDDDSIQSYSGFLPNVSIRLNHEELDYIQQKGSVMVAMPRNFHPLVLTAPFVSMNSIAVRNKASSFPGFSWIFRCRR